MEKRIYITTPIYYVNAEPHIGHAYTTILADFLKRFYSLLGYDSYFVTGTDEHGDKIVKSAEDNNSTPEAYTDRVSDLFKKTWADIGIKPDDFIRTTEERHKAVVRDILSRVYDQGDIYFDKYGGHYCLGCERFFTEKEIVDGKCPEHNKPLKYIEEENYFFKMSKYQDWLIEHISNNENFIRPERYKNEVLSILKNEVLEDLCISRPKSRLKWGITLPFDENYVTYVWFDALINYISSIGYPDNEKFKKYWPVVQHIIAKDIVKPHGIFWPTMLKAAGIEPYQNLNVHGYWNMDDAKMSKSLGNVVSPGEMVKKYGNDQVRYFFLREMTFGLDAKYSEEAIINRINYDLANDLGNLIKRTFNMVQKYFNSEIPGFNEESPGDRDSIKKFLGSASADYIRHINAFQFSVGIEKLWEFIRFLNKYIDDNKPWQLAKEGADSLLASVMRNLLEAIHSIAILLSPLCITMAPEVIKALKGEYIINYDLEKIKSLCLLDDRRKIDDVGILFPKLEKENQKPVEEDKRKMEENKEALVDGIIDFSEFKKVDLRVAKVLEAERVEGSEKLLELRIDTGLDERTIIAGLAQYYDAEYMKGKKILVVANLKPAKIFKKKSQGMLLAARKEGEDRPVLIEIDDKIPVGAKLS